MKKGIKRIFLVLAALVIICGAYGLYKFRFAGERLQLKDESTGQVTFGYDPVQEKWLFSEMPRFKLGIDGPHIFNDRKNIVYIREGDDSCYLVQESLTRSDSILCTADGKVRNSFHFTLKERLVVDPAVYPMPERLLAISDIEGSFQILVKLLIGNKVVDKDLHWTYGNGHLVLNGDFVDRGHNVTECLWLIYKLEDEAAQAGGKVHYIVGNHEQLNLQGIVKYVAPKYRELAFRLQMPYKDLFGKQTELGRWLRTKNVMEKIGDLVFVHGGVSPQVANSGLSVGTINEICRADLDKPREQLNKTARLLLADSGILWYRGLVRENPGEDLSQDELNNILHSMNASAIVVGHTIVNDVSMDYGGKVIRIDIKHTQNEPQALIVDRGIFYKTNTKGELKKL